MQKGFAAALQFSPTHGVTRNSLELELGEHFSSGTWLHPHYHLKLAQDLLVQGQCTLRSRCVSISTQKHLLPVEFDKGEQWSSARIRCLSNQTLQPHKLQSQSRNSLWAPATAHQHLGEDRLGVTQTQTFHSALAQASQRTQLPFHALRTIFMLPVPCLCPIWQLPWQEDSGWASRAEQHLPAAAHNRTKHLVPKKGLFKKGKKRHHFVIHWTFNLITQ